MLHGFPECWYSWRHQMAALADDWDVVALDMRGYNTSDKPQVKWLPAYVPVYRLCGLWQYWTPSYLHPLFLLVPLFA